MKQQVAYIGFGHLGKQLSLFLRQSLKEEPNELFFDDHLFAAKQPFAYPFEAYKNDQFASCDFYVCIGYRHLALKTKILDELKQAGRSIPSFIHRSSILNPTATVGIGVIIFPGCNIDQYVTLEDGVLLNNSVTISHNTVIGKSSFIAPGVTICGNVRMGIQNFTGSGSIISNNIEIGNNVITGIGTVITKNIPDGFSVIGNPMKILTEKIKLT